MSDFISSIGNGVKSTIVQLGSTVPHSVLFGSVIMYMITMSISYGVFAIFILELILSHRFLSWFLTEINGPAPSKGNNLNCYAGFKTAQEQVSRILSGHEYPSYSFFSITAIASYLGFSTFMYSDTLKKMGTEWDSRPAVAYSFIICVLLAFLLVRLGTECDNVTELLMAFVLAVICGGIFFKVNIALFGDEAVNFLGLPYMVTKNSDGDTVYVCVKNQNEQ